VFLCSDGDGFSYAVCGSAPDFGEHFDPRLLEFLLFRRSLRAFFALNQPKQRINSNISRLHNRL
jgi:hypothetical protein